MTMALPAVLTAAASGASSLPGPETVTGLPQVPVPGGFRREFAARSGDSDRTAPGPRTGGSDDGMDLRSRAARHPNGQCRATRSDSTIHRADTRVAAGQNHGRRPHVI